MKIAVLNGSPKGLKSVTMQYVSYLEKVFPGHSFTYINAAAHVKRLEKDEAWFNEQMNAVRESDIVIWGFPLYYLLVSSQYKRFIELIHERKAEENFRGKYCGIICTSIHFMDNFAVNYINAVCDDLDMNFVDFFAAHMHDLMDSSRRASLKLFFENIISSARSNIPMQRNYHPVEYSSSEIDIEASAAPVITDKKVTVITDSGSSNTVRLAGYVKTVFPCAETMDLGAMKFGPCLGCLKCGFDNICAYEGRDEFIDMHRKSVLSADIIIYVLTAKDRYLSSVWQKYLERTFHRTHQPVITGKQTAFIISGPLSQNLNTRSILQAYSETMGAKVCGIISDESGDGRMIGRQIDALSSSLKINSEENNNRPVTFLGTAGMKLFRDEIFGGLKTVFQKDHQYYRKHGIYDFPTKQRLRNMFFGMLGMLVRIPAVKKNVRNTMKDKMLLSYKKILENAAAGKL